MDALRAFFDETRARGIPVIREDSAALLASSVAQRAPEKILEIGTAVGCSGILMLLSSPAATLTTIEIDEDRYTEAKQHFAEYGLTSRVRCILDDCTEAMRYLTGPYDFIFLDGPKAQYPDMLPYLLPLLGDNGMLFADDVSFFGQVEGDAIPPHKNRTIVLELRRFRAMLTSDPTLDVRYYDTIDGTLTAAKRRLSI